MNGKMQEELVQLGKKDKEIKKDWISWTHFTLLYMMK